VDEGPQPAATLCQTYWGHPWWVDPDLKQTVNASVFLFPFFLAVLVLVFLLDFFLPPPLPPPGKGNILAHFRMSVRSSILPFAPGFTRIPSAITVGSQQLLR